jgi:hypothetical protein
MIKRSVNKSEFEVPPRVIEKAMSRTVPRLDAIQKEVPGCFLCLITAMIAVTRGITAAITETCADVVRWSARAIKIGHPKTAPRAVKAVGRHSSRGSFGTFAMNIRGIAKNAAITGRAKAVKSGSKLLSANLVKGRESENAKIPRKAKKRPLR